jgi:hypothetical protein
MNDVAGMLPQLGRSYLSASGSDLQPGDVFFKIECVSYKSYILIDYIARSW